MPLPGMGKGLELEGGEGSLGPLMDSHSVQSISRTACRGTCETPLQSEKDERMIK